MRKNEQRDQNGDANVAYYIYTAQETKFQQECFLASPAGLYKNHSFSPSYREHIRTPFKDNF